MKSLLFAGSALIALLAAPALATPEATVPEAAEQTPEAAAAQEAHAGTVRVLSAEDAERYARIFDLQEEGRWASADMDQVTSVFFYIPGYIPGRARGAARKPNWVTAKLASSGRGASLRAPTPAPTISAATP